MQPPEPVTGAAPRVRTSFPRYLWLEWVRPVGEAILVAFLITTFVFTTVGVVGDSDRPMLYPGERLIVPKYETWLARFGLSEFKRGELVVVKPNSSSPYAVQPIPFIGQFGPTFRPFFIKRLVGLPGDRIRMDNGQLYVNGERVDETHTVPYWKAQGNFDQSSDRANSDIWPFRQGQTGSAEGVAAPSAASSGEYVVPEGQYFVMGDNRSPGGSEDSRGFGPVPLGNVGGRATTVIWPPAAWRTTPIPEAFRNLR